METILSIKNLSKRYGSVQALKDISFEIKKGHVYGILGPNGSGKSTTLGIVLNVVNKTSGKYSWFGGKMETHDALKKVGAIIERPNFYPYMTAQENLRLVCKIKDISYAKIQEKLHLVGLDERKDSKFSTFSLGMKQRLAIAATLLSDPEVLVFDEPTNGLDPIALIYLKELIQKEKEKGKTILITTHIMSFVNEVADEIVFLLDGKIYFKGSIDALKKHTNNDNLEHAIANLISNQYA